MQVKYIIVYYVMISKTHSINYKVFISETTIFTKLFILFFGMIALSLTVPSREFHQKIILSCVYYEKKLKRILYILCYLVFFM